MNRTAPDAPKQFHPPSFGEWIHFQECWYLLGNPIGNGSFGVVYECVDEWGNQLAAKVLVPNGRSYEEIRDRWNREIGNLVNLRHPNITYIHQAFEYRDTFFLILEKCEYPLSNIIGGPDYNGDLWLPSISRDVLHALNFIHGAGYVHKDLHPGNIFVFHQHDRMVPMKPPAWLFKVADLGISNLEGEIHQSATTLAGWMRPPESIDANQFGGLDRRVDIYHSGLLFLAILLGRIPSFTEQEILDGQPRRLASSLQSPYASVIAKALRRHVDQRIPSAIEFWRELKRVNGGMIH